MGKDLTNHNDTNPGLEASKQASKQAGFNCHYLIISRMITLFHEANSDMLFAKLTSR